MHLTEEYENRVLLHCHPKNTVKAKDGEIKLPVLLLELGYSFESVSESKLGQIKNFWRTLMRIRGILKNALNPDLAAPDPKCIEIKLL
jgi:hypothetical protein